MSRNLATLVCALACGSLATVACHSNKGPDPKVVAALDDSLKAGTLTQADHDAKLAAVQAAAAPPVGKVEISSKFKTVEIRDEAWGIVAVRMQIPENWNFEGILIRDPSCDLMPMAAYRLSSPDGLAGYQVLPTFGWHWSDDPGTAAIYRRAHCKMNKEMTAAEFLAYVAPGIRPNPIIGPIEPTPDAGQIAAMIAQYNARLQQAHMTSAETGSDVRSRLQYIFHGQPIEENLRVDVQTFKNQTGYYGGPVHHVWASTASVAGYRAPKGQLDDVMTALGPTLVKVDYTDEWKQRMAQKMAQDNANAMAWIKKAGDQTRELLQRQQDAYMKQSTESFEKSQQVDRDRTQAMHQSAVAWELYASDDQLVRNTGTGQVSRVTNQSGTHGYQDQTSGQIVMSTDPNFDPSFYLRGTWSQLENVNPIKP